MSTWPEARAAKAERQRREAQYYTPDLLGRPCPACGLKVVLAIGADYHPTCGPEAASLLRRSRS